MSTDLPQSNWDFISTMKNKLKEASGAPEMAAIPEEAAAPQFQFGSDEGDTPDPDL